MKARVHWWIACFYSWLAARAATVASYSAERVKVHCTEVRRGLGVPDKVTALPCCPGFLAGGAHNEWCHKMQ